ncbi:uncharacterized protein LOC134258722 isoform X3 [Saccostrea cucullata]|uniref:uncharacterized protein LOC134258722 isoform X3 n=1 Tax=Saccostrea cuccullata TaxID=36930 RepID=UPI002ED27175
MFKINISHVLALLLMTSVFIEDSNGAWWSWTRRRKPKVQIHVPVTTQAPVCPRLCSFSCEPSNKCGRFCCFYCYRSCNGKYQNISLPCKFSVWDKNGDGAVSKTEFVNVTQANKNVDVDYVFKTSDKNADNVLSKEELRNAPIIMEKC